MSDLISRSALTNKIRGIVPGSQDVDFIVRLIDEQPTAYNPEKVVEIVSVDCYSMGFDESQAEIIVEDIRKGGIYE